MTLEGERKFEILEREFLRMICGSKKNNIIRMYENRSHKKIYNFGEPDITVKIWYKILSWLGHVLRSNTLANEALNWRP